MQINEELLWRYIDGDCDANEQAAIRRGLAADEDLRAQYCDLLTYHTRFTDLLAQQGPPGSPSPGAPYLSASTDELRRVYDALGSIRHN